MRASAVPVHHAWAPAAAATARGRHASRAEAARTELPLPDRAARDARRAAPSAGRARTTAVRALRSATPAPASVRNAPRARRRRGDAGLRLVRGVATPPPRPPAGLPPRLPAAPRTRQASVRPTAAAW